MTCDSDNASALCACYISVAAYADSLDTKTRVVLCHDSASVAMRRSLESSGQDSVVLSWRARGGGWGSRLSR